MKKLTIIILLVALGLLIAFGPSEDERAYKILETSLKNRYKEDFKINNLGKRSDGNKTWYEATVYPKSYIGTPKEYDYYYRSKGFVTDGKGGDTHGANLYKESANMMFLSLFF